jgi:two-component system copper resistance phosphate regulon response regulator CusR
MHILIVEDERKTREYLQKGLGESGYVVDTAADGVDGLHLALTGDYDLVILDIMLPGADGRKAPPPREADLGDVPTARDEVEDRVGPLSSAPTTTSETVRLPSCSRGCARCPPRAPREPEVLRMATSRWTIHAAAAGEDYRLTNQEFALLSPRPARARCRRAAYHPQVDIN